MIQDAFWGILIPFLGTSLGAFTWLRTRFRFIRIISSWFVFRFGWWWNRIICYVIHTRPINDMVTQIIPIDIFRSKPKLFT